MDKITREDFETVRSLLTHWIGLGNADESKRHEWTHKSATLLAIEAEVLERKLSRMWDMSEPQKAMPTELAVQVWLALNKTIGERPYLVVGDSQTSTQEDDPELRLYNMLTARLTDEAAVVRLAEEKTP